MIMVVWSKSKSILDGGANPPTSTKSILNWTQDRRRLKVDWSPQVCWRLRMLLMGVH